MTKSFVLSAAGLKNLVLDNNEEFSFIIGEQEIKMNKILAEFISPRVSQLHRIDPTIDYLNFDDIFRAESSKEFHKMKSKITISAFLQIEKLFECEKIEIAKNDELSMQILSIFLGNEEMFAKINELYTNEKQNDDKNLADIELFECFSKSFKNFDLSSIIDSISSHFYSIDQKRLLKLSKSTLYSIISNKNLKIENEDSLFEFINLIFKENENEKNDKFISEFYEEIEFEYLSKEKFQKFLRIFDINDITNQIWKKLSKCFNFKTSKDINKKRHVSRGINIPYKKDGNQFNGIIKYLSDKCGGNVSEKKVVEVTCDQYFENNYPQNVVDFNDSKKYFESLDNSEQWLKYDFKDMKVLPTHYTIQSSTARKGSSHLKSWNIEGSNTGNDKDWIVLDSQNNEQILNGVNLTHTFEIKSHNNNPYRYLRLRQIGKSMNGQKFFSISALEYYGLIKFE